MNHIPVAQGADCFLRVHVCAVIAVISEPSPAIWNVSPWQQRKGVWRRAQWEVEQYQQKQLKMFFMMYLSREMRLEQQQQEQ